MQAKLKAWIELQELPKHIGVLLRLILGATLAWYASGHFNWGIFLVALAALFLITDGAFISNEYFDYKTDKLNTSRIGGDKQGITTTGGTRVLVKGLISRRQALIASLICFIVAMPLGLLLQFGLHSGPWTIPLGALGILIGWFYTAPPVKAAYRGWGEILMMTSYGLLIFTGYYIIAGPSWLPVIVGLPRIVSVLPGKLLRSFPDREADAAAGKRTLAVIFGAEKMIPVYEILTVLSMLLFIPAMAIALTPFTYVKLLICLINIVPLVYLVQSLTPVLKGGWRTREKLILACKQGFIGRLLVPLTFTITFLLIGIIKYI